MTATILYFPTNLKKPNKQKTINTGNEAINNLYLRMSDRSNYASVIEDAWRKDNFYYDSYINSHTFPFQIPVRTSVKSIQGVLGKNLNSCDPFAFLDRKYQTSLNTLKMHKDSPLVINTRSDLISFDCYIEHLQKHHVINICYKTLNESESKMLDPGTPSIKRRKKAYFKLKKLGYNVNFIQEEKLKCSL